METLSFRHPLIAMIVKEVLKSIRSNVTQVDSEERLIGITLLTDLLNRLAADARCFSLFYFAILFFLNHIPINNIINFLPPDTKNLNSNAASSPCTSSMSQESWKKNEKTMS